MNTIQKGLLTAVDVMSDQNATIQRQKAQIQVLEQLSIRLEQRNAALIMEMHRVAKALDNRAKIEHEIELVEPAATMTALANDLRRAAK